MGVDFYTSAWTIVNFLVLLYLLKRFLYKPVFAAMEKRSKEVEKRLKDAEQSKKDAAKEKEHYTALLKSFEKERQDKLAKVTEEAHILQENMMRDIKKEGDFARDKLQKSLVRQKETEERKWRLSWMKTLSVQTGKILQTLTSQDLGPVFFQTFLQKLPLSDDLRKAFFESDGKCVLVSSFSLSDDQKNALSSKLNGFFGKEPELSFKPSAEETGFIFSCHFYLFRFTFEALLETLKEDALP